MPRKPRFELPGVPQHVIQRGNNREPCFYAEADYLRYRDDLRNAAEKYACVVHAYVLMTNHVHLLVSSSAAYGISQMMQSLGRRYVRYINREYRRTGTLWEGRFKAALIDTDAYLLTCMRYIELNPVRAAMSPIPANTGGRVMPPTRTAPRIAWSGRTRSIWRLVGLCCRRSKLIANCPDRLWTTSNCTRYARR